MLITGDHADITFKFKETNQSIPAHRAILSARSTYFEAMFKGNMRESYESEIVIDASRSIFYKLLQFIYTNEVDRLETCEISDIIDLLILSNIYSLDSLRTYCEKVLARLITCENISQLLLICVHHDAELLKEACVKFVEDNKKELSKNADFRREIEAAPEVGFILLFDAKLPKFSDCLSSDVDVQDTKRRRVSTESTANTINNNTDGHDTPVGQTVVPPQISLTNNITNSNEDNN